MHQNFAYPTRRRVTSSHKSMDRTQGQEIRTTRTCRGKAWRTKGQPLIPHCRREPAAHQTTCSQIAQASNRVANSHKQATVDREDDWGNVSPAKTRTAWIRDAGGSFREGLHGPQE